MTFGSLCRRPYLCWFETMNPLLQRTQMIFFNPHQQRVDEARINNPAGYYGRAYPDEHEVLRKDQTEGV
jgi:hypothetical protein